MLRGFVLSFPLALSIGGILFAQPLSSRPVFDVASIRASRPGDQSWSISRGSGGRFVAEGVPLRALITFAYELRDQQVSGGPTWVSDDKFDITAKPDRAVPVGPEGEQTLKGMLRELLKERFRLIFHRDSKEMPIYVLVVANGHSKLTPTEADVRGPNLDVGRTQIHATKVTMDALAKSLSNQLGRTVIDRTGLTADYTFKLDFAPESAQMSVSRELPSPGQKTDLPSNPEGPSIFTALQEQLGLKVLSEKGPVEIFVIDHAEKPSDN